MSNTQCLNLQSTQLVSSYLYGLEQDLNTSMVRTLWSIEIRQFKITSIVNKLFKVIYVPELTNEMCSVLLILKIQLLYYFCRKAI